MNHHPTAVMISPKMVAMGQPSGEPWRVASPKSSRTDNPMSVGIQKTIPRNGIKRATRYSSSSAPPPPASEMKISRTISINCFECSRPRLPVQLFAQVGSSDWLGITPSRTSTLRRPAVERISIDTVGSKISSTLAPEAQEPVLSWLIGQPIAQAMRDAKPEQPSTRRREREARRHDLGTNGERITDMRSQVSFRRHCIRIRRHIDFAITVA